MYSLAHAFQNQLTFYIVINSCLNNILHVMYKITLIFNKLYVKKFHFINIKLHFWDKR